MDNRIVIIDGNSLINRAYYAMQRPMITKEGLYTQGVYGFLNMLAKIEKDYEPAYIAVTFDRKAPTFRHLAYAEYKAGRKGMPPELAMQMPLLKEVLAAMRIKMYETDGYEADDLIGTIARKSEEAGLEPLIITGDRDALQLASGKTNVLITKKGISEFEMYDESVMMDRYGLTPEQFIDLKGLMGDQSDNIPGIPGVGEKTALKLLHEFGSVESLIENADSVSSPKLKEKIEENAQLAMMSKRLATINTDAPIEFEIEETRVSEPDYDELINVYTKLEFNSFLKKLKAPKTNGAPAKPAGEAVSGKGGKADNTAATAAGSKTVAADSYAPDKRLSASDFDTVVLTADSSGREVDAMAEAVRSAGSIALKVFSDGNHRDTPHISGIAFLAGNTLYYISESAPDSARSAFFEALGSARPRLIGHDLKTDLYALMANGLTAPGEGGRIFDAAWDTAVCQYVIDASRSTYDIETLALEYLHEHLPKQEECLADGAQIDLFSDNSAAYAEYAAKRFAVILNVKAAQEKIVDAQELTGVYTDIELPLIEVLASMEYEGFSVNRNELDEVGKVLNARIDELTGEIYALAGEEFNINSPVQLGTILFEKLGLSSGKKTKRGYSTNAEVLEKIRDENPIVGLVLEYRMLTKLRGTYIDGLIPLINRDGRIHAHFMQTVTQTGRISCVEPNLQNIPVRQELGRTIRKAFIPGGADRMLVGADYSQIELRVLAHMADDANLIEAFGKGDDIHRITAARVFGVPEEEVTPIMRSNAKAVNFGVIYGMSGFGLSGELNITRREAEKYINDYFEKYADVKAFMDEQIRFCRENGYVRTMTGRRRSIPEISASAYMVRQLGERLAMNTPIQGSAADIIKIAMNDVYAALNAGGFRSRLILQVHDELIIETYRDEADAVNALLRDKMENAVPLRVRLAVGMESGENWYELK